MNLKAFLISALPFDNVHLVGVDGGGQNMDQGSMDPLSWTRSMHIFWKVLHQVHGHSKNRNSAKKRFDETLSTNAHE